MSLVAEVLEVTRKSGAEEERPDAVGESTRGEWVFLGGDPLGEIETSEAFFGWLSLGGEKIRSGREENFAGVVGPVASWEEFDRARNGGEGDESGTRVGFKVLFLPGEFGDLLAGGRQ